MAWELQWLQVGVTCQAIRRHQHLSQPVPVVKAVLASGKLLVDVVATSAASPPLTSELPALHSSMLLPQALLSMGGPWVYSLG
jgi:hypothetical protein